MAEDFELHVNGTARVVRTEGDRPLLDVLREDLALTGAKNGCGEGACRACTVIVDGRPVASCTTPVSRAAGKKITTIEGLSEGEKLHPVQEAFLAEDAMQCGFCVAGMIMTAVSLLDQKPNPTDDEIAEWMNGNICRCCGYPNLMAAVRRASGRSREEVAS